MLFGSFVPFASQLAVDTPMHETQPWQPRIQYSAITGTETRLPEGIRPPSLLSNRTGLLLVGDLVFFHRSEVMRTVDGSLQYVEHIASALPIDRDDESIVDALVVARTSSLTTRPLRRRDSNLR